MSSSSSTQELKQQFINELRGNILPYWMDHTLDRQNGGFYGAVGVDGTVKYEVERNAVLCARILWTFSTAGRIFQDDAYKEVADWAFQELSTRFWDSKSQGIYWSIDRNGQPVQDRKHTYAQAFSIYGLTAYYRTSGNENALSLARHLFKLIDKYSFDAVAGGNIECLARDWSRLDDMRLSAVDLNSQKSMNTMLHLMEAYAALFTVWPDEVLKQKLSGIMHDFINHIIDPVSGHQRLFFDNQWNSLSEHVSYGHDIETSWLLLEAANSLGNPELITLAKSLSVIMAQAVLDRALGENGSIMYESGPNGYQVVDRQWWAHAEAVVGFYNAFQISNQTRFKVASLKVWEYIQEHFIERVNGDWYKLLREDGTPVLTHNKVGPWECPYHHARMCLEMAERLRD